MRKDVLTKLLDSIFKKICAKIGINIDSWDDLSTYANNNRTNIILSIDEFGSIEDPQIAKPLIEQIFWLSQSKYIHIVVSLSHAPEDPIKIENFIKLYHSHPKYSDNWSSIVVEKFQLAQVHQMLKLLPKEVYLVTKKQLNIVLDKTQGRPKDLQKLCALLFTKSTSIYLT